MKQKRAPVPGDVVVLNHPIYSFDFVNRTNSMGKFYLLLELREGSDWEAQASTDVNLERGNAIAKLMSDTETMVVWLDAALDLTCVDS